MARRGALNLRAAGMQQLLHLRRGDRELQAVQVGHGYVRVLPRGRVERAGRGNGIGQHGAYSTQSAARGEKNTRHVDV